MKYIIYCRKSSDENTDRQVQSIPDQIEECVKYATLEGLEIASRPQGFEVFETEEEIAKQNSDPIRGPVYRKYRHLFIIKEQKTAKEPGVREKRNELMRRVNKYGKVKGILSYHPDRQARNMEEGGKLITMVDDGAVDLKYTRFHFEPNATGKMMLGFLFVFSKNYSDTISENVGRGLRSSVEKGKAVGKSKYGYVINDEGYFQPDGKNFELMKHAFHLKIYENKTNEFIGQYLNAHGFTRSVSKNRSMTRTNWKDLNRIWIDPFYYGIHIYGQAQSDQREYNPYYRPLITEDEYVVLEMKLREGYLTVESRDENAEINPLGKGLLISEDNIPFVHDFPNKKRYMKKLEKLQKTKQHATLSDVVESTQIYYSMKNKKSNQLGMSISYADIEKQIFRFINLIQINENNYKGYVEYMTSVYDKEKVIRDEKRLRLQLQRNVLSNQLNKLVRSKLLNERDATEIEVYNKEKTRIEQEILFIDNKIEELNENDGHALVALEGILEVYKDIGKRFAKLDYVRKGYLIKLLFSNILINRKKQVKLLPFPYVESLLVAKSADDATRTRNILLGKEVH